MKRVVILSFAHDHANFWAEAFLDAPEVTLAGIWDDVEARGREAAHSFGVPFIGDLRDAVGAADAVAICSENSRHAELVETGLSAGKAILCEKPIAATLAQADRIVEAVAASGVLFMQSFPKRLDPVSHALKDFVESGALGDIHLVRIRHGHSYGLSADFKDRWYVDPELGGGGALLDEGVHGADLLCWLFGMPQTVVATVATSLAGLRVEDGGTALFSYADGMTAELTASFLFAAAEASIEVYGTRGTVLVSGVDLASRDLDRKRLHAQLCRRRRRREALARPRPYAALQARPVPSPERRRLRGMYQRKARAARHRQRRTKRPSSDRSCICCRPHAEFGSQSRHIRRDALRCAKSTSPAARSRHDRPSPT